MFVVAVRERSHLLTPSSPCRCRGAKCSSILAASAGGERATQRREEEGSELGLRAPRVALLKGGDEVLVGANPTLHAGGIIFHLLLVKLVSDGQNLSLAAGNLAGFVETMVVHATHMVAGRFLPVAVCC